MDFEKSGKRDKKDTNKNAVLGHAFFSFSLSRFQRDVERNGKERPIKGGTDIQRQNYAPAQNQKLRPSLKVVG